MEAALNYAPRQLVLDAFCDHFQTTRITDDAILRAAIPRLFLLPGFTSLTRSFQEVLIALLARRDFRDPRRIHPSAFNQQAMAMNAGVSRSTLKRAYDALESLGWINRSAQGYDDQQKRYEGTPIELSAHLVDALQLQRSFEAAADEIAPRAPQAPLKKISEPVAHPEPLIKDDSPEQSLKRQSAAPAQGPKPVPSELSCLISRGLSCWTVFWLMKLSSRSGKRLSDVVEVLRDAIEKRDGRQLVGFLQTKIRDNVDYAWKLRQLRAKATEQTRVHQAELLLDDLVGQQVRIEGLTIPVLIKRMASGFYGETRDGGIVHGAMIKLARAGKISRWDGEVERNSSATAPATRNIGIARDAIQRMRAIVGIK